MVSLFGKVDPFFHLFTWFAPLSLMAWKLLVSAADNIALSNYAAYFVEIFQEWHPVHRLRLRKGGVLGHDFHVQTMCRIYAQNPLVNRQPKAAKWHVCKAPRELKHQSNHEHMSGKSAKGSVLSSERHTHTP